MGVSQGAPVRRQSGPFTGIQPVSAGGPRRWQGPVTQSAGPRSTWRHRRSGAETPITRVQAVRFRTVAALIGQPDPAGSGTDPVGSGRKWRLAIASTRR